ncbi:MAG: universal stress protein [Aquabacterium sp.]
MSQSPSPVRLVWATDLSEPAALAGQRAAAWLKDSGGALLAIHVLNPGLMAQMRQLLDADVAMPQRIADEALKELTQALSDLQLPDTVTFQAKVLQGPLLTTLLDEVQRHQADALVLGAQGEGMVRRLILGSTAERLVGRSATPVLVVRQPAQPYRRVLVPVDFSPASLRALTNARRLCPGARLLALHVFEVPFEHKMRAAGVEQDTLYRLELKARQQAFEQMAQFVKQAGLSSDDLDMIVAHGSAPRIILAHAEHEACDLVVMGKRADHAMEDLLIGSVTRHVLSEAAQDVLVVA